MFDVKLKLEHQAVECDKELDSVKNILKSLLLETSRLIKNDIKKENESLLIEIEKLKRQMLQYNIESFSNLQIQEKVEKLNISNSSFEQIKPSEVSVKKPAKEKKPLKEKEASDNQPIDVSRLDFRIGHIIDVQKHPDADSLYVEQIDVGEDEPRTVVSGLVKHMPPEDLKEKLVVLLCNLKPAKMRGITSQAMVMCASTPEKIEILIPPDGCQPGDLVEFNGYERLPDAVLNPKKKIFETCAPDLQTNSNLIAVYKGVPFEVIGKGFVKAKSLRNIQIR